MPWKKRTTLNIIFIFFHVKYIKSVLEQSRNVMGWKSHVSWVYISNLKKMPWKIMFCWDFLLPASLDPLQFAYRSNRSTDDAIAFTLHTALSHLENKNTYVRMLFVDYSLAFNTIVPATLVVKPGTEQISVQLDPGLPDRQKSGGQNGQQHLISPDPQHWCSAGLRPQPTPVLPVHTRLYSKTQLQCHCQICWRHNGDRPDHRQRWDGLQRGGEYPD